jgi:hypothetical protein
MEVFIPCGSRLSSYLGTFPFSHPHRVKNMRTIQRGPASPKKLIHVAFAWSAHYLHSSRQLIYYISRQRPRRAVYHTRLVVVMSAVRFPSTEQVMIRTRRTSAFYFYSRQEFHICRSVFSFSLYHTATSSRSTTFLRLG